MMSQKTARTVTTVDDVYVQKAEGRRIRRDVPLRLLPAIWQQRRWGNNRRGRLKVIIDLSGLSTAIFRRENRGANDQ